MTSNAADNADVGPDAFVRAAEPARKAPYPGMEPEVVRKLNRLGEGGTLRQPRGGGIRKPGTAVPGKRK